jgi:hypothetical protein
MPPAMPDVNASRLPLVGGRDQEDHEGQGSQDPEDRGQLGPVGAVPPESEDIRVDARHCEHQAGCGRRPGPTVSDHQGDEPGQCDQRDERHSDQGQECRARLGHRLHGDGVRPDVVGPLRHAEVHANHREEHRSDRTADDDRPIGVVGSSAADPHLGGPRDREDKTQHDGESESGCGRGAIEIELEHSCSLESKAGSRRTRITFCHRKPIISLF